MTKAELRNRSAVQLLRMRDAARYELSVTPAHLYPMCHDALCRRLAAINAELAMRAISGDLRVKLTRGYDPDASLESQLDPRN